MDEKIKKEGKIQDQVSEIFEYITQDDCIVNVLPSDKFLSSEHERESDSIRNIIEENDEIY